MDDLKEELGLALKLTADASHLSLIAMHPSTHARISFLVSKTGGS
jgi:hypothetical protein